MTKDHGPSIKDDETYEALRDKGYSKGKAAAISNAEADPERDPSAKGGHARSFDDRTVDELRERAAELGIEGRSGMNKDELIRALRDR